MHKFKDDYLDKEFLNIIVNKKNTLKEIHKNIYYGKIFNDKFLDLIINLIDNYESSLDNNSEIHANSMHENAIPFSNLNLNQCINDFIKNYFTKIANLLYPDRFKKKFDGIHSYVVRYGDNYDRNLGFHVDDSLITINLCLKNDSKGSELCFSGIRCPLHIDTPSMKNEKKIITHEKGFAVIHDGKNRHHINDIYSGERYNLIIWCQDKEEKFNWFNSLENNKCLDFCEYK